MYVQKECLKRGIFEIFCINKTEVGMLLTADVWKYLLSLPIIRVLLCF